MKKIGVILLILSLSINIILGLLVFKKSPSIDSTQSRVDSLEREISEAQVHKDSVGRKIDTIEIIQEKIKVQYEKDRNTIINNNTSDDYLFFTNYLKRYDSLYLNQSAKNN